MTPSSMQLQINVYSCPKFYLFQLEKIDMNNSFFKKAKTKRQRVCGLNQQEVKAVGLVCARFEIEECKEQEIEVVASKKNWRNFGPRMNEVDQDVVVAGLMLSPSAKKLVRAGGFRSMRALLEMQPASLARELGMDPKVVLSLVKEIQEAIRARDEVEKDQLEQNGKTVLALLDDKKGSIVTYCRSIDEMLGGGIPLGEITEMCGVPGAGKTQICMQAAVDVTVPTTFGGVDGECLYIDTEGSFSVERIKAIAEHVFVNLRKVFQANREGLSEKMRQRKEMDMVQLGDVETMLSKIHYCRVHNHAEQVAAVLTIRDFVAKHPKLKLVIIDSVAFHFRQQFSNSMNRTKILNNHAQTLNALASELNLAVLVTNQMTTKIASNGSRHGNKESSSSYFAPALGESWSHTVTNRIILRPLQETYQRTNKRKRDEVGGVSTDTPTFDNSTNAYVVRTATLAKSPYLSQAVARFIVTESGVRDCK